MNINHRYLHFKSPAWLTTLGVFLGVCIVSFLLLFTTDSEFTSDKLSSSSVDMLYAGISFLIEPAIAVTAPPVQKTDQEVVHSAITRLSRQKLFFTSSAHIKTNSPIYRQLQKIFSGVFPKNLHLRQSQRFSVIYDRAGRILLATVTFPHKTFEAVRYTNPHGYTGYYTPTGEALFKSLFLTAPVKYTRISDPFSHHRWHPILHVTRPHYGIDYAAPAGTPIVAISSGVVSFAGWNGGYGNTVILDHGSRYQSLYAHLKNQRYTVKPGQWVAQGQVIGYVGSTGLATGPHLHFGIYDYGRAVNPTAVLPKIAPPTAIAQRDFPDFLAKTNHLFTQLALADTLKDA
jgi:murein DD-endopeptidase MepM/ murein hydrolase activator NlpD